MDKVVGRSWMIADAQADSNSSRRASLRKITMHAVRHSELFFYEVCVCALRMELCDFNATPDLCLPCTGLQHSLLHHQ